MPPREVALKADATKSKQPSYRTQWNLSAKRKTMDQTLSEEISEASGSGTTAKSLMKKKRKVTGRGWDGRENAGGDTHREEQNGEIQSRQVSSRKGNYLKLTGGMLNTYSGIAGLQAALSLIPSLVGCMCSSCNAVWTRILPLVSCTIEHERGELTTHLIHWGIISNMSPLRERGVSAKLKSITRALSGSVTS